MKIPTKEFYIGHLNNFAQYSQSRKWNVWYATVARHKALRTAQILGLYKNKDAKLLDLGCGIGLTLSILAQKFPNSVGCDIDKDMSRATNEVLREVGLKTPVIIYDGKKLPFKNNEFDIVASIEVIEHVQNPQQFLKEIFRVLKKDGVLHITTANKWWPYEPHFKLLFLSYLPESLADVYVRLSGRGESYHGIKLPSYGKFKGMLEKQFNVEDITLNIIREYKKYHFDQERGRKVILVGKFLQLLQGLDNTFFSPVSNFVREALLRVSLGWLFIARPRK